MKFVRLAALTLLGSALSFGASKEILELQRDVALLQDKMDTMQRDLDTKLGALTAMLQAVQDNSAKSNASLQDALSNGVGKQLAPVTSLSTKVDSMGEDVRALRDALNDLGGRLERMDAKMPDLKTQMQTTQPPPAAPGVPPPGTAAPGAAPGTQPQQGSA